MYSLVNVVVENYKEIYPYLEEKKESIKKLILEEENLFQKTGGTQHYVPPVFYRLNWRKYLFREFRVVFQNRNL